MPGENLEHRYGLSKKIWSLVSVPSVADQQWFQCLLMVHHLIQWHGLKDSNIFHTDSQIIADTSLMIQLFHYIQ
jgi:hypothetical protein